jgi:twinkle protein
VTTDQRSEILAYCSSKGWQVHDEGDWIRLGRCPIPSCGSTSRRPFAFRSDTGAATCHRCGWSGGLFLLKQALGDLIAPAAGTSRPRVTALPSPKAWQDAHAALLADATLLAAYHARRGLSRETIERFKVGIRDMGDGRVATVMPYFGAGGRYLYSKLKVRMPDGSKRVWREPKGTESALFNAHALAGNEQVIVCEGEEDCAVLVQLGLTNVVSVPDGANIRQDGSPWLDALEAFAEIVIAFDRDEAGRAGADKLARVLGPSRCRVVTWPETDGDLKDPTDFLVAGRGQDLLDAIAASHIPDNPLVQHVADESGIADLIADHENPSPHGLSTCWPCVDRHLGGVRAGELTIVTGHTNSGKSAFVTNLATQIAAGGTPVVSASFELTAVDYRWRVLQQIVRKYPHARNDGSGVAMTTAERDSGIEVMRELPLYLVNHFGGMSVATFVDLMRYASRRYGARVFVLDHLHFMVQTAGDKERFALSHAIHELKTAVIELNVALMLVAHPSRHARDKESPDGTDLHGSAALEQVTDNLVTVARKRDAEGDHYGTAVIAVKKLRRGRSGRLGSFEMSFDRPAESFRDPEATDYHYAARASGTREEGDLGLD